MDATVVERDAQPASRREQEEQARNAFRVSVFISGVRCLVTYLLLPALAPLLDLTGSIGPVLGLIVGAVSMTAIVFSIRRFWTARSRWRWAYTVVGGAVFVLLVVQAAIDVAALLG
jgi:hypothetical protein